MTTWEGSDHIAYEIGDLVVRTAKPSSDALPADAEARLLALVADVSPLPVPRVRFVDGDAGVLAYRRLPGVPLLQIVRDAEPVVARQLGAFLRALHAIPIARVSDLVPDDSAAPAEWLAEARADRVPAEYRAAVEAFLAAPPPPPVRDRVFTHNDLGIEHVLVDPESRVVTGVLDWSDAALADPAADFGRILRDLGPAAFDVAAEAYGGAVSRERALFYARCGALEDLAYGLPLYWNTAVRSLGWLFVR